MQWPVSISLIIVFLFPTFALSQAEYRIYAEHPRLLLSKQQIKRLRGDIFRQSVRWRQLEDLIDSKEQFPEMPLVKAFQFQVLNNEVAGRQAVVWALGNARQGTLNNPEILRLSALVFDWCHNLFSAEEKISMARLLGGAAASILGARNVEIDALRGAVLAVAAAAGDWDGSETLIRIFFQNHWKKWVKPALLRGELLDYGYEIIAVMEICHVVRRNLERDLWQETRAVFEILPRHLMLSYYPYPIEIPEGIFREPAFRSTRDFGSIRESTLRRIGEMLLVAYETHWEDYRFLQGWLRHDAFMLKTPLGALYEFLWVNPYLPGLSYSSAPLFVHDEMRGRVLVRSGWNENDSWLGYLNGELQVVADGKRHIVLQEDQQKPLGLAGTIVVFGRVPMSIKLKAPGGERIFVVGLGDQEPVRVKIGRKDFEVYEPGRGGILHFENPPKPEKAFLQFDKHVKIEVAPGPWLGPSSKRRQKVPTLSPGQE